MSQLFGSPPYSSIPSGSTATSIVVGVLDNGIAKAYHTAVTQTDSGTFTTGAVQLQVSLDGSNWLNAGSAVTLTTNSVQGVTVNIVARFARLVISTAVTGGGTILAGYVASA